MSCALFLGATIASAGEIRIIDGDTFAIGRERIRIAEIDAPETHEAKCRSERRLGLAAKGRLAELLASGKMTLRRTHLDIYGRTLAFVFVDGKSVGSTLINEGFARPYRGHRRPWCGPTAAR